MPGSAGRRSWSTPYIATCTVFGTKLLSFHLACNMGSGFSKPDGDMSSQIAGYRNLEPVTLPPGWAEGGWYVPKATKYGHKSSLSRADMIDLIRLDNANLRTVTNPSLPLPKELQELVSGYNDLDEKHELYVQRTR
jgi:hypothetical protein